MIVELHDGLRIRPSLPVLVYSGSVKQDGLVVLSIVPLVSNGMLDPWDRVLLWLVPELLLLRSLGPIRSNLLTSL